VKFDCLTVVKVVCTSVGSAANDRSRRVKGEMRGGHVVIANKQESLPADQR
jgi:hypothetical protein